MASKKLSKHDAYKKERLWKFVDVDLAYWAQCVDLAKHYVYQVYGTKMWYVGSAKDCSLASFGWSKHWQEFEPWIVDMKQGDVVVSWPTKTNKHWHIGIVDYTDKEGYWLLEQNTKWGGTKTPWNEIKVRKVKWGNVLKFFRYTA